MSPFNFMKMEDIKALNDIAGVEFEINDGKVVSARISEEKV